MARRHTPSGIRIGIGGWSYKPWRGEFYPAELVQKRELAYASTQLNSIEINSTFYGSQKPASFSKWHDETPDDFVFAVKGPRFVTNRRALAEAGESIQRFFRSGVLLLRHKLGPVNWQLAPTKVFDATEIDLFLGLLPHTMQGQSLRHAIEVRHNSFATEEFFALARKHGVAIVVAGDSVHPRIDETTAPFVYARIMGTTATRRQGYTPKALDAWAAQATAWSEGGREVFLYVISGFKQRNPAAAMALLQRLKPSS